jgi:beta-N-acetylhexosaminidase
MRLIAGVFCFMCGALFTHLLQSDWSVVPDLFAGDALVASAISGTAQTTSPSTSQPSTANPSHADPVTEQLAAMTIEEKIGQLFVIGHWREDYYQHTERLLQLYDFGGVIIMKTSDEVVESVPEWTTAWQDASKYPLMISIDQEGGVVSRLRAEGFTTTSQRELASIDEASALGQMRGAELRALGINTNLAPVLDYASSTDAFLYDRSFARRGDVAPYSAALIEGHAGAGVLAIPKHFPGHDNTPTDSHVVLPIVDITAADFPAYVAPFREALAATEVEALMTAHVQFPKLDDTYPTTLSYEILSRQLRRDLGFEGVIITDDMTMGAITNTWDSDEAAILALQAGADMILFSSSPNEAIAARNAMLSAIEDGTISEDRIDESVERILRMKQ